MSRSTPSSRCSRAIAGSAALVACLAWSVAADAKSLPRVVVNFQTSSAETPTTLCVVARSIISATPLTKATNKPTKASGKPPATTEKSLVLSELLKLGNKVDEEQNAWSFVSPELDDDARKSWRQYLETHFADTARAIVDLAHVEPQACGHGSPCSPLLELHDGTLETQRIVCKANLEKPVDAGRRVAFVRLDFFRNDETPPPLKRVELAGTVAAIDFDDGYELPEPAVVRARSLGGHYTSGDDFLNSDERINVALHARCSLSVLQLPPYGRVADPKGVSAQDPLAMTKARDPSTKRCAQLTRANESWTEIPVDVDGSRRITVSLPYDDLGAEKQLRFTATTAVEDMELIAHWKSAQPPTELELGLGSFAFLWHRDCLFPTSAPCPAAKLLGEAATTCKPLPSPKDACIYRCPADETNVLQAPTLLHLPATVRFDDVTTVKDDWTDEVAVAGDQLAGYVPPERRHILVDFAPGWTDGITLSDRGLYAPDPIDYVEIASAVGEGTHIPIAEAPARVKLPGIACDDYVSYRIVGARRYRERTVQVKDGRIALEAPKDLTTDSVSFGAALGGGCYRGPEWKGYGTFELIANWRPDDFGQPGTPWVPELEARVGYIFSKSWYYGIDSYHSFLYNRFPFTIDASWYAWKGIHVGALAGLVVGNPYYDGDVGVKGKLDVNWTLGIPIRYPIPHSTFAVEAIARIILRESTLAYSTDYLSTPRQDTVHRNAGFLELRIRMGL